MTKYRIAVDTGGTFTDAVVTDGRGGLWADKAPTTPSDPFVGVEHALAFIAPAIGVSRDDLLGLCELFTYATTHATNAIIVGNTAITAFLTTKGFPDILVMREGGKFHPFDFSEDYPEPYIPRRMTFEICERVSSEGDVVVPLERGQVVETLSHLGELDVEAIAVCLLWSFINPVHELAIGDLIRSQLPGVPFTLSHQLTPVIREYRRASATAIDASLKPLMTRHFANVEERLRSMKFNGELLVVTSSGGVVPITDVIERPIYAVGSGPAICPVGALAAARDEHASQTLVVCDMGGTSFDVSLVREGIVEFARETWLGGQFTGHITGLPSVAVHSIGAGGGSIAWIDDGGLLRVGPKSAGSQPGPVAYGQGGEEPTVTDAALVLGYIDPEAFLGGRMALDAAGAKAAIAGHIATPLGIEADDAAAAILALAVDHMVGAIREITVNQGLDPRECLLVGGGGASGLCVAALAAQLGSVHALIPSTASVLSACGGLYSDIVSEVSASFATDTGDFDKDGVNEILDRLDTDMDAFLTRVARNGDARKQFIVEARYRYQVWELEVPLDFRRIEGPREIGHLEDLFHEVHERVFGVREPGQHLECLYWRGRALAKLPAPESPRLALNEAPARARSEASAYFPGLGRVAAPRYKGERIASTQRIAGPAMVDLPTTTIVVFPGCSVTKSKRGHFLVDVESADELDFVRKGPK